MMKVGDYRKRGNNNSFQNVQLNRPQIGGQSRIEGNTQLNLMSNNPNPQVNVNANFTTPIKNVEQQNQGAIFSFNQSSPTSPNSPGADYNFGVNANYHHT